MPSEITENFWGKIGPMKASPWQEPWKYIFQSWKKQILKGRGFELSNTQPIW